MFNNKNCLQNKYLWSKTYYETQGCSMVDGCPGWKQSLLMEIDKSIIMINKVWWRVILDE